MNVPVTHEAFLCAVSAHYSSLHSAIKMLIGRVSGLHSILTDMAEGELQMARSR